MINLSIPQSETQLRPRITVVGVGGAGGNAVNNMIKSNLEGVEFLVANTDAQALSGSLAAKKLQLGVGITQGLGAGSRPDVGRAAAEEALEEIVGYLDGSHMVFITAGMGGGTGTGAAPVIARAARDQGILTVGVVTKPFHFEGAHRMRTAENGLNELQQYVDTLIVIPNQNLFRIANEKTTFADAFKMADDVLHSGVRGVTDLMVMPGLINLDFADIRTVMGEMGKAMMGTGEAEGEHRSVHAAEAAISNPLLDDVSMKGARGVLINITGGLDMTLYEVDEAANRIRDEVDQEANIIFGSTFDESMEGRVRVSVVATGIDLESQQARPSMGGLSLVGGRSSGPIGISRPAAEASRPEPAKPAAAAAGPRIAEKPAPAAAVATARPAEAVRPTEEAVLDLTQAVEELRLQPADPARTPPSPSNPPRGERREGAFIAPRPVEPSRPQPIAPPRAESFAEAEAAAPARTADQMKKKAGNIFRRVTGLLRDEEEAPPVQAPAARPLPQPQPPRAEPRPQGPVQQGPRLDVGSARGPLPKHEDDTLDIPAFLRRQAN